MGKMIDNLDLRGVPPPLLHRPERKEPDFPLKGDWYGWFLIIVFSILLPIPFAVISRPFGPTIGPILFGLMTIGFPIWAVWYGTRPYDWNK